MNYFQLLYNLHNIYHKFDGQSIDRNSILKCIKRSIPFKECQIYSLETLSLPNGKFNVSGLYDPDQDEQGKPPIVIEIAFPKKRNFVFDESDLRREHWAELCIDLASTLGHEFIHLNQFRKRNYRWTRQYKSKTSDLKLREMQEYYGDSDEIGAYAFMAAAELTLNRASVCDFSLEDTNTYKLYTQVFGNKDPVVLKLSKLIKQYNKKLEKQYHATNFQ
jgi:hypothetical protein